MDETIATINRSKSYPANIRVVDSKGKVLKEIVVTNDAEFKKLMTEGPSLEDVVHDAGPDAARIETELPSIKSKSIKPIQAIEKANENEPGTPVEKAKRRVKREIRSERGSISFRPTDGSPLARDLALIGRDIMTRTGNNMREWMSQMIREIGNQSLPYLRSLWDYISK